MIFPFFKSKDRKKDARTVLSPGALIQTYTRSGGDRPFDCSGLKLLIIDDNRNLLDIMKVYFEKLEASAATAGDGRGAERILRRAPDFDAIFIDLNLPDMSGPETANLIRRYSGAPLIFMSGAQQFELTDDAAAYLPKPFAMDDALKTLGGVLMPVTLI